MRAKKTIVLCIYQTIPLRASLVAQKVKNPPAMREAWVRSLGWEDPLEKGMATHSSILAWRISWIVYKGFPCGSDGKEMTCNVGGLGSIPGLGRSPGKGKGYALQYTRLENSMNCIVHRIAKSQTQLRDFYLHLQEFFSSVQFSSVQFISVAQSCQTLCDPMNRSIAGLPVHHPLPEFTQTHVH